MKHRPRETSGPLVAETVSVVFVIYVAWIGAWMLKGTLDRHVAWVATSGGAFACWTAMKLLLWILPSAVLIRLSGRPVRSVFGTGRLRPALAWGAAGGLLLGAISLIAKAAVHQPLFSPTLSWSLVNVLVIAPVFEEFMFRGAVLGNLMLRYRFPVANTLTAALFLGLHLPGWHFQGSLWTHLVSPVGGAVAVFLLGWIFGLVAHRSNSVVASMLTHGLNNLFS